MDWAAAEHPLSSLSAFPEGTIEGEQGATHADFANRWIGGGVLRKGCVQEEIRFAIAPECLLSLCLCEVMDDAEAVVITGPERYAQSTGYASSFCYAGHYNDNAGTLRVAGGSGGETDSLTRDIEVCACCRRRAARSGVLTAPRLTHWILPPPFPCALFPRTWVQVAAMDALKFHGSSVSTQYEAPAMRRECTKALAAMVPTSIRVAAARGGPAGGHPFASGNWGCGVFGGHHELKSLLQWVAASVRGCGAGSKPRPRCL